jgi:hypothetical protein
VINGLEEAQECNTNILASSYDKTRAFDSLSRNAARIALYRMGVPVKVCEMLVGLDIEGKTVVRTPKARKLWDTLMQQSNNTSYEQAAEIFADIYFIAIRGVGQGDTPSPFIWDAFFDILLVALKLGTKGKFWLRARQDKLVSLKDQAYADDSLTPCSDIETLQRKADIVSTFAMIFGFDISIKKLRSLIMEWGSEIPDHIFPKIKIHKWGWTPCEVGVGWRIPEKDEEGNDRTAARMGFHSLRYLGIQIDSNAFFESLFQETLKLIRNMCRIVRTKKASADLKACSAYTRILNMATYRGSAGPWSLERLREWDKPLEALYRKIHKCLPNTPTEIIYLDPKEDSVGLGMPCLSDRCQEEKWGKIHRSLCLGGGLSSCSRRLPSQVNKTRKSSNHCRTWCNTWCKQRWVLCVEPNRMGCISGKKPQVWRYRCNRDSQPTHLDGYARRATTRTNALECRNSHARRRG